MPDAFDALRIGRNAMPPLGDFAEGLLGQIREELGMTTTTTTTTTLRELYYTTITVGDLDRALTFFQRLFGWEGHRTHVVGDKRYVNIEAGVSMGINDDPDTVNLWFVADDLDDAVAKVRELGGAVEPQPGEDDYVICVDDQGVRFGLGKQTHGPVAPIGEIPNDNICYITINVPDEPRGRRFYGDLLGWRFEGGLANPGFVTVPMGLAGGSGPGHTIFVKVADVGAKAAEIRALGGSTGVPQQWPSGVGIECTDDQGTLFWITTPAPGY